MLYTLKYAVLYVNCILIKLKEQQWGNNRFRGNIKQITLFNSIYLKYYWNGWIFRKKSWKCTSRGESKSKWIKYHRKRKKFFNYQRATLPPKNVPSQEVFSSSLFTTIILQYYRVADAIRWEKEIGLKSWKGKGKAVILCRKYNAY